MRTLSCFQQSNRVFLHVVQFRWRRSLAWGKTCQQVVVLSQQHVEDADDLTSNPAYDFHLAAMFFRPGVVVTFAKDESVIQGFPTGITADCTDGNQIHRSLEQDIAAT